MTPPDGGRCRTPARTQAEIKTEAAERIAAQYERKYGLEPRALLSLAWIGADHGASRWSPGCAASFETYVDQGARYRVLTAIRDGELDGSRRLRDGRRVRPCSLESDLARAAHQGDDDDDENARWRIPAPPDGDVDARLDAAALLARLAHALGDRSAVVVLRIDGEGSTQRELADDLGVSLWQVHQLRAKAHRAARSSTRRAHGGDAA